MSQPHLRASPRTFSLLPQARSGSDTSFCRESSSLCNSRFSVFLGKGEFGILFRRHLEPETHKSVHWIQTLTETWVYIDKKNYNFNLCFLWICDRRVVFISEANRLKKMLWQCEKFVILWVSCPNFFMTETHNKMIALLKESITLTPWNLYSAICLIMEISKGLKIWLHAWDIFIIFQLGFVEIIYDLLLSLSLQLKESRKEGQILQEVHFERPFHSIFVITNPNIC